MEKQADSNTQASKTFKTNIEPLFSDNLDTEASTECFIFLNWSGREKNTEDRNFLMKFMHTTGFGRKV